MKQPRLMISLMGNIKVNSISFFFLLLTIHVPAQVFIDWNARWSYFKGISEPSQPISLWRESGFNASDWTTGNAPFSYGEDTGGTLLSDMPGNYTTFYIRKEFNVDDLDNIDELKISVDYDDGFVLWINGTLTLQNNTTGNYAYNQGAPNSHESGEYDQFTLAKNDVSLVDGSNTIAIQGFNFSKTSSDFFLDVKIEGIKKLPETTGVTCNSPSGFYNYPFNVTISSQTPGETVKYTLDGSDPRISSTALTRQSPVSVNIDPNSSLAGRGKTGGVILRASKFEIGYDPSKPITRSYIFISQVITQTYPGGGGWPTSAINGQVIDLVMDSKITSDMRYKNLMDDALLDLPSISVVTDPGNLFNSQNGIYVNSAYHGRTWERPANIELINPDGSPGFNIDAGLRIRGGWSRHDEFAKHAFRLFFRSEYGEGKLKFPLFGDEGVDEFDKVDLRTSQNYSWSKGGEEAVHCTMNRDVFSRDCQGDMHQPYTRSRYYHLYLNGIYWGIYQTQERSDGDFAESYLGGSKEDYDVIKVNIGDNFAYNGIEATDGNTDAWEQIWNMCQQGFSSNANYFKLLGLSPAGKVDTSLNVWVDIDNLIDFMLIVFYTGNFDSPVTKFSNNKNPNNFYAIFDKTRKREGFKFLLHDAEHTLLTDAIGPGIGLNENRVNIGHTNDNLMMNVTGFSTFHPQWLHYKLAQNQEYRMRFADRVYRHFFNDGVFNPDSCVSRFRQTSDQLKLAIIAESARWGDQGSWPARTKDNDWIPAVNRVIYDYMPYRTAIVLKQLLDENLYITMSPPVFKNNGTVIIKNELTVSDNFNLFMENPNPAGSIIYTTDGTDPRAVGGAESNSSMNGGSSKNLVILPGTHIKARIKYTSTWSALHEIYFQDASVFTNLKVTELHYHPPDQGALDGKDLEFIELKNIGTITLDLSGLAFTTGIEFTFPAGSTLAPKAFVVIASNKAAFSGFYGFLPNYEFSGNLSNGGEKIVLVTSTSQTVFSFTYSDTLPWPVKADGEGYSLIAAERNPRGNPDYVEYWTTSYHPNGSPGAEDLMSALETPVVLSGNTINLEVYPNPVKSDINIDFSINTGGNIEIELVNVNGGFVQRILNEYLPAGKYHKIIHLSNLTMAPGIYLVVCKSASSFITKKIIYIK